MLETEEYIGDKKDTLASIPVSGAVGDLPVAPYLGGTSSQPSLSELSSASSFPSLFSVEACILYVKPLTTNPNHHCHRVHQSRRCDYCLELEKTLSPSHTPFVAHRWPSA